MMTESMVITSKTFMTWYNHKIVYVMATKPLIKESLFLLNTCGVNPANKNLPSKILATISLILMIHFLTELTLEFALKWRGWDSVNDLGVYFGYYLITSKIIVIILNGRKVKQLLISLSKFDSLKNYDLENQDEIEAIFKLIHRLFIIYGFAPVMCLTIYGTAPIFRKDRSLPFKTYHPLDYYESYYYYQAMYAIQLIDFVVAFMTMYGFDILFLSFITHIICEYKLLKIRFLNLKIEHDNKNSFKEVKPLIAHHNSILRCVRDLDNIYSVLFLVQFFFSLVTLCTGLLNILVGGFTDNLNRLLINAGYVFAFLGQLLVYCVAGAFLKTESESLYDSVYSSDWCVKTQPELRRAYTLIIQRAQKGEELTAGGMFPLNLVSFTKILKTTMSFFMLAHALYARSSTE